ncbi:MAG: hypothetical protein JWP12_2393 [Bacteroidetes bacterium]|nr:hypothetical protein [Bacteroidota bacterium]
MPTSSDLKKRVLTAAVFVFCFSGFFIFRAKRHRHQPVIAKANPALPSLFKRKAFQTGTLLFSGFTDLENVSDKSITSEKSFSGIKSSKLSMATQYGFTFTKKISDIPSYQSLNSIQLQFKCWMRNDIVSALYVLSVEDKDGKNIYQQSRQIICATKYEWNDLQYSYSIDPKLLDPENMIRLYAWNKEQNQLRELYVDDIRVSFFAEDKKQKNESSDFTSNFLYDFETVDSALMVQKNDIREAAAHSGKMVFDLSDAGEYGPVVNKQLGDVCLLPVKKVNTRIWVYPLEENASVELDVALFNAADEKYFIQTKKIAATLLPKNKWTKINATFPLPQDGTTPEDLIQVLVLNKGKTKLLLDDFEIVYDDVKQAPGDPSMINASDFTPQRNKPPFKTMYLNKQEIGNANSPFIINAGNTQLGDFTPGDEYASGHFCGNAENTDQVIQIKAAEIAMYGYCPDKKQFLQLWKSNEKAFVASEKITGDFDNNHTDDLLLINKKRKIVQLVSFSPLSNCSVILNIAYTVQQEQTFENWNITADDIFMSGDFNGDHKTELLIVNSKIGNWGMFQHDAAGWKNVAANKMDPAYFNAQTSKHTSGHFYADKNKDVVFISVTEKEKQTYTLLEFNSARKQFDVKNITPGDTDEIFFKHANNTFAGDFESNAAQEFVNLNTDWRFDLKLIKTDAAGFNIMGNVDFKGYPADHNPKYYEFVKMIPGHFISKEKTAFIVIMRNCADKNFNGDACKQYENLDYLPNSTQLYQFEQ